MSLPAPPVPLVDTCSTIYNNTLYSYSPAAFQSLPLVQGAKWSQLPSGESVSGATCVQATPSDGGSLPALYIVGGTTNSSGGNYEGLQRYIFSEQRWESISPSTAVTQNRINHNAVYLNASSSILVYAGSQDGDVGPSSETFTISTLPPYTVLAYESIAPPTISPLLMSWSPTQAVMMGGDGTNKKLMLFSSTSAWVDSNITLAQPLKSINAVKAVVLDGDDGSKNLFTFDMTVSPNEVNRTLIRGADGQPVSDAEPVTSKSVVGRDGSGGLEEVVIAAVARRTLTGSNWPAYNSTLAPTSTRNGYTISQDQSGLVVISGGNDGDVLCMFRARDNSWENAAALFGKSSSQEDATKTAPATASSATPTASQSSSAGADNSTSANSGSNSKLLGAILGSVVVGVAVVVLLTLFLLRRRRNQRRHAEIGHQRRASGLPADEKEPMDFADRGLDFPNRTPGFGHGQQDSQGSFSSVALLMGKVGHGQTRSVLERRNGSNGSDSSSTFNKKYKSAISNPIPQVDPARSDRSGLGGKGTSFIRETQAPSPAPRPRASATAARRGSTRRSSGWNRYWSGGSALNILGFGQKRMTDYSMESNRASGSQYSDAGLATATTQATQMSATIPPLNLPRSAGRMSRVPSNSPTIAHAGHFPFKESMAGQIERPDSSGSAMTYGGRRDTASSGIPASVHQEQPWTPVGGGSSWVTASKGPKAAYSESNYSIILPRGRAPEPSTEPPPLPHDSSDMSWLNLGPTGRRD